jgi:two-component system cell cycle response regulator
MIMVNSAALSKGFGKHSSSFRFMGEEIMSRTENKIVHVLLVEHHRSEMVGIRLLLTRVAAARLLLEEADSVSTALQRLTSGGIDLVLLDSKLPDSEALEGLGRLRSRFPAMPVIMLADLDNKQLGPKALAMGAKDCIVKDSVDSYLLGQIILRNAKGG